HRRAGHPRGGPRAGRLRGGGQDAPAPRPAGPAHPARPALPRRRRMMTCQEAFDLLMDYLDGGLEPARRQAFEAHLQRCPECVTYLESYRLAVRLSRVACETREGPCERVPEGLVRAVLAACPKRES